jgi:DNA-binding MarR family transcriptional regulator
MRTRTSQRSPAVAESDASLLLDNQVCFALYSASLAMTRLYKPLLADLGLTYPQYLVMLVLWEGDALMVSELGERLGLDSGTLTPLLKRLESLGLLTRQRDAQDERRVHVHLSPAGRHLKMRARKLPACILESTRCSLDELRSLNRQVRQLHQRLLAANDL